MLFPGVFTLENVPAIADVEAQLRIAEYLGASVRRDDRTVVIDSRSLTSASVPALLAELTSASFLFAGALVARLGRAQVALPGGDAIGPRPVYWHAWGIEAFGAASEYSEGAYSFEQGAPSATTFKFPGRSVNGTVNVLFAALATTETRVIANCVLDPDVQNVLEFLRSVGCTIEVVSSDTLRVRRPEWPETTASVAVGPDRNDTATFAALAALSSHGVVLRQAANEGMAPLVDLLSEMGVSAYVAEDGSGGTDLHVRNPGGLLRGSFTVVGESFPGFSTDWGPLIQVLLTQTVGRSEYREMVFKDRFQHVPDLVRMGSDMAMHAPDGSAAAGTRGGSLSIRGPARLRGCTVTATNIRAAAALVVAAVIAEGDSVIEDAEHLWRGYHDPVTRLNAIGVAAEVVGTQSVP